MALNIKTFFTRTLTAIVFVAVLLSCILLNYFSFTGLFLIVSIWGLVEFYQLVEKLDNSQTENYLLNFSDAISYNDSKMFESTLYLMLYTKAHERFPHNLTFVKGLLKYYKIHQQESNWRNLAAEYFSVERHAFFFRDK